jgi:hypothetical protein
MFDVSVHSLAFGWPGSFRAGSSFGRRSYAHSLALSSINVLAFLYQKEEKDLLCWFLPVRFLKITMAGSMI